MPLELPRYRKVAEAATQGPWHYTGTETDTISPVDEGDPYICADVQADADAAFISTFNPAVVLGFVAELEALHAPEWVRCSERMPEDGQPVWCCAKPIGPYPERPIEEATFGVNYFETSDGSWPKAVISHWAPRYVQTTPSLPETL